MSAGAEKPFSKFKNHQPPAVSVVTFSADVAQLYKTEHNSDPESLTNDLEEISQEFDESSGFAIVINGHSLVHCLTPELEIKQVYTKYDREKIIILSIVFFYQIRNIIIIL